MMATPARSVEVTGKLGMNLFFSWSSCDCCHTPLGGDRVHATGYNPTTEEIMEFSVCIDCIYYSEYGCLDDMTMDSLDEEEEDDI